MTCGAWHHMLLYVALHQDMVQAGVMPAGASTEAQDIGKRITHTLLTRVA